ncbi:hypothetical protein [Streptomyces smyrnaeus]|uniref:hypothetical protein n=1 Tax=Streptomyces smyrnaeus TaxID=1387713 RepID=UPI000C3A1EE2
MAVSRKRKKKNQRTTPVWEGQTVYAAGHGVSASDGPSHKAVEVGHRAAEADRVWFDRHPGASVRVREALPGEHDHRAFGAKPLAPNQKIAVVVVQAAPGRRTRIPFMVVTVPTAGARISPQQLAEVRQEWESSDKTAPVTTAGGQVVDALAMMHGLMTQK